MEECWLKCEYQNQWICVSFLVHYFIVYQYKSPIMANGDFMIFYRIMYPCTRFRLIYYYINRISHTINVMNYDV